MVEGLDVLDVEGVFLFCILLRVSRQGISSSISIALTIINLEVITREFLGTTDLPGAQTLRIHKLTKVVMVCKDEDLVFAIF